ncbi:sensor histidine kinase [Saliterribacillus persicus]|uniref:histidine kinase n=1 Tax=Saliterribacillus persicus TaxID=930114 RepID=A0A368Y1J1_9BACI|nr:sensor histidine kinase [Saliterribacillus persicus]RCW73168.1 two-component system sensor histidine kinase DesK [Saliterribacillus persicus]
MHSWNWYHIFPKNTGLSLYIWIIFCILPFYFIFRSSSWVEITIGIAMIILFFTAYRLSFVSKGRLVYISLSIEIIISLTMTLLFGFVYFAIFLAFFIGNVERKAGFVTLYVVHLVLTILSIAVGFIISYDLFFNQLPFIAMAVIGVILLPINRHNRIKQDVLEGQLHDANEKLAKLAIVEERQRIARDLHDTLGQKLSMIGLKSDLAIKLLEKDKDAAEREMHDVQYAARQALKEVRELVSEMKGVRLNEEIVHVEQILNAAEIDHTVNGEETRKGSSLLVENVLSMCLKEAVTNVVKHSQATKCEIMIADKDDEVCIQVKDNGIGFNTESVKTNGNGLKGMEERLQFVNGHLKIDATQGSLLTICVPRVVRKEEDV